MPATKNAPINGKTKTADISKSVDVAKTADVTKTAVAAKSPDVAKTSGLANAGDAVNTSAAAGFTAQIRRYGRRSRPPGRCPPRGVRRAVAGQRRISAGRI